MTIAAAQLREWIETNYPQAPISRFACRDTAEGFISQHSAYGSPRPEWSTRTDSNALDVFGPLKAAVASDQDYIQLIVDHITEIGWDKWSIRNIIWRDGDAHENHAHIDFYPMITMHKWCGGPETPDWRLSNGDIVTTRDPEPENGEFHGIDGDCPWTDHTYPPCSLHYWPETDMELGVGEGQHQGQCNVPEIQQPATDWAFGPDGRFKAGNKRRYDYTALLTEGREMVFEYRDSKE